jgi:hypothetical protein
MTAALRRGLIVLALVCLIIAPAFSQAEQPSSGLGFKMGMGIGVQTFNDNPPPDSGVTYQSLSFLPDISFGKFGVGLDVTLNYRFGTNSSLVIRQQDWWPTGSVTLQSVLAIYLPKIAYIRWGEKGDPLFLKLGSFNDATLGDGFIMGDYNNMLFLPTERHFGFQADLDGVLFNFPYVGVETVVGNLAQLDVLGVRAYVRPLAGTPIPILNALQIGVAAAVDTNPFFNTGLSGSGTIAVFGVGALAPVIDLKDVFSLLAFADAASIQGKTWGSMAGVGGKIISIFTYGAQLRLLSKGFIPTYFGPTYDALRGVQYNAIQNISGSGLTFGGLITAGTSLLGDKLIFKITLDSPFVTSETDPLLAEPHLNGILTLAPGVVPVFSFDFIYDKKGIGNFVQIVDPTNAAIQAKLNLQSGPAVISFVYYITYDARQSPNPWTVTSGLQSSIALF